MYCSFICLTCGLIGSFVSLFAIYCKPLMEILKGPIGCLAITSVGLVTYIICLMWFIKNNPRKDEDEWDRHYVKLNEVLIPIKKAGYAKQKYVKLLLSELEKKSEKERNIANYSIGAFKCFLTAFSSLCLFFMGKLSFQNNAELISWCLVLCVIIGFILIYFSFLRRFFLEYFYRKALVIEEYYSLLSELSIRNFKVPLLERINFKNENTEICIPLESEDIKKLKFRIYKKKNGKRVDAYDVRANDCEIRNTSSVEKAIIIKMEMGYDYVVKKYK